MKKNSKTICSLKFSCTFAAVIKTRDVAQLASAPRSGRGGRKFESSHPDYKRGYIERYVLFPFLYIQTEFVYLLSHL